jgi:hypothetical protein
MNISTMVKGLACVPLIFGTVGHAPKPIAKTTCITFIMSGRTATGHEYDEPVTFCGKGIPVGSWTCVLPSQGFTPGVKVSCVQIKP